MKKLVSICLFIFFLAGGIASAAETLPDWDGVYLKTVDGQYHELKQIKTYHVVSDPSGNLFYNLDGKSIQFTDVPENTFKGILIKGKDLITSCRFRPVYRTRKISLIALFSKKKSAQENKFEFSNQNVFRLRQREVADDAMYFEPEDSAINYFGNAVENGSYVSVYCPTKSNGLQIWFFGIVPQQESTQQATK